MPEFESGKDVLQINLSMVRTLPKIIWGSTHGRLDAMCFTSIATSNAIIRLLNTSANLTYGLLNKPDSAGAIQVIQFEMMDYFSNFECMNDRVGLNPGFAIKLGCNVVDRKFHMVVSIMEHVMVQIVNGHQIEVWKDIHFVQYRTTPRDFKSFIEEVFGDALK